MIVTDYEKGEINEKWENPKKENFSNTLYIVLDLLRDFKPCSDKKHTLHAL
jgi:hypothetical protein